LRGNKKKTSKFTIMGFYITTFLLIFSLLAFCYLVFFLFPMLFYSMPAHYSNVVIYIGNHTVSSSIWNLFARVSFSKNADIARAASASANLTF